MTFQEAEKIYKDLKLQHSAGKVTDADFETQVNQLKAQDPQGRWWQLGVRTGEWYYNDGQKWVKGKPPIAATPAPPENQPAATAVVPPSPVPSPTPAAPTPAPVPTAASAVAPDPQPAMRDEKPARASVMPRGLFAPKPEGSGGGGISRPVLIGIIAVAAVVVIALLVGGYVLFSRSFGGAIARATPTLQSTPTQAALIPPTSAFTPTAAVTDTPAATATAVVTQTNTVVRPTNTRSAVVARTSTPTKAAAASATPAPPPGLYATKIVIDRSIEANQKFGFRVTFFNSTGGPVHKDKWQVVIYRVSDLVVGAPEKSFGESHLVTLDVPVGTTDILIPDAAAVGPAGGNECKYLMEADYIGDNNNRVVIPNVPGKNSRFPFEFCQ